MKLYLAIFLTVMIVVSNLSSCSNKCDEPTTQNPVAFVTNSDNLAMLTSLKSLDDDGRLLEMTYTADYKLDELIKSNVGCMEEMQMFMATKLFDIVPEKLVASPGPDAHCSAFAATEKTSGDFFMGRNYDFCHVEDSAEVPITCLVVKTQPEKGKKSICLSDTYWLGYKKGFYNDGKSDLSMLMGAPYVITDGMNEDGFATCVLHLDGNPARQSDPSKNTLWVTVVMRALLDNVSTVNEAIEYLKQYNVSMATPAKGNMHFFIADATGDFAIIEYSYKKDADLQTDTPDQMVVLKDDDKWRYVTNFYVDPQLADDDWLGSKSQHGKTRYETLRDTLTMNVYKLSNEQAMNLLKAVSQPPKKDENTSHTQWSALYNLSKRTLDFSILREYEKIYSYKVE